MFALLLTGCESEKSKKAANHEKYISLRMQVTQIYKEFFDAEKKEEDNYDTRTFMLKSREEQTAILQKRIDVMKDKLNKIKPILEDMKQYAKKDLELAKDLEALETSTIYSMESRIKKFETTIKLLNDDGSGGAIKESPTKSSSPAVPAQEKSIKPKASIDTSKMSNKELSNNPAVVALKKFHYSITTKNYKDAYNCLGDEMKKYVGTYDKFVQGYATTNYSIPLKMNLVSFDGDSAVVEYELEAEDKTQSGLLHQTFSAKSQFKLINGSWKIVDTRAKKIK